MEERHAQPHDLSNTVIAILATDPQVDAAVHELTAAGLESEVLNGESGRSHLDADAETGMVARLRQMARALGDETRILRHLDRALAEGRTVISVDIDSDSDSDQASLAATILEHHDGKYLWRFGEWSFNRIGTADEDEEGEVGEGGDQDKPPAENGKQGPGGR